MRTVEEIQLDIRGAQVLVDDAARRMKVLLAELAEARVATADHPWLGKIVQRKVQHGFKGETRFVRGKLMVYGAAGSARRYRGLYRPQVGDLIVVTVNGTGSLAYAFYQPVAHKFEGETEWEIMP